MERFLRGVFRLRLWIESLLLILVTMFLYVDSAVIDEPDAIKLTSNRTANKAFISLLWLFVFPLIIRLGFGWKACLTSDILSMFGYKIITGIVLVMLVAMGVVGLAIDHPIVLLVILLSLAIEIPTYFMASSLLEYMRASERGGIRWSKIFDKESMSSNTASRNMRLQSI